MATILRTIKNFKISKSLKLYLTVLFLIKYTIVIAVDGFELQHLKREKINITEPTTTITPTTTLIETTETTLTTTTTEIKPLDIITRKYNQEIKFKNLTNYHKSNVGGGDDDSDDDDDDVNDDDEEIIAFAETELREFIEQKNLTEAEIGIKKPNNDLIFIDIARINNSSDNIGNNNNNPNQPNQHINNNHFNNKNNNLIQNEEIQNLTTKMIDEDNEKIIEIEKKILNEQDKSSEVLHSKKGNDDLIQVSTNTAASQTLNDLVIDDDCSSEEDNKSSGEYKRIEEYLKTSNKNNQINSTQIDFNDFIQLIPTNDVRLIFHEYYRKDKEVQRGYTYLMSKDFQYLKVKILSIPEVNILIKYLLKFGLDIVQLSQRVINLIGDPRDSEIENENQTLFENETDMPQIYEETTMGNKIENVTIKGATEEDEYQNSTTTTTTAATSTEQGLHGLLDSILEILPQDQIISLFFEKLETNYEFSNLVNNIGNDEFSRILQRMQDSIQLKHIIFTLHNNGIFIERIIESLKGYFFLGV